MVFAPGRWDYDYVRPFGISHGSEQESEYFECFPLGVEDLGATEGLYWSVFEITLHLIPSPRHGDGYVIY